MSQRAALQNATFDFQSTLSQARSRALERGSDVWVIIYPDGGRTGATGGQGAYFVYEDLTMRFAGGGVSGGFGYDDFSPLNTENPILAQGKRLESRYLADYAGGTIRFQRVGSAAFQAPFTGLSPSNCSVCLGSGGRGALVFTGHGTVRFYNGAGAVLDVGEASVAIGNPAEGRGFLFGISGATGFVAAQASY